MFLVFKEIDPDNSLDYQERVKGFLEINEVCSFHYYIPFLIFFKQLSLISNYSDFKNHNHDEIIRQCKCKVYLFIYFLL